MNRLALGFSALCLIGAAAAWSRQLPPPAALDFQRGHSVDRSAMSPQLVVQLGRVGTVSARTRQVQHCGIDLQELARFHGRIVPQSVSVCEALVECLLDEGRYSVHCRFGSISRIVKASSRSLSLSIGKLFG